MVSRNLSRMGIKAAQFFVGALGCCVPRCTQTFAVRPVTIPIESWKFKGIV
jgi:hypothetical protein